MPVVATRPFSPKPGQPFTGHFCYTNANSERTAFRVNDGNPEKQIVELAPGRYYFEWIAEGTAPVLDVAVVPDEPEVELADICNSLKSPKEQEQVSEEILKENTPQPVPPIDANSVQVPATSDPTVESQPPATEQTVASEVTTKKK